MIKNLYVFCLLLITSFSAFSQTATVRGFLYNKDNGEPIIFNNVYLKGTQFGGPTDVNGFYAISKIPEGNYTLLFTTSGFDTISIKISLKAGQLLNQNLYAQPRQLQLKEFEVKGDKEEERTKVGTSVTTITSKEINKLPTVGAEPDLAQYLQVLPGVTFTGDQGGQLYIRGGAPIQNKVLLDGMIIYNPFHSIGLFSVFDTDIIRNADVYTGGFGAEFGGRISSIMKITTKDGDKKHIGGKVSVSPFVSKLQLEGPLSKFKEGKGGSSSYILSARTSYLKQSSKVFYPYVDTAGLPFNFRDLYGKLSFYGDNGSKLNISGFNFTDKVTYQSLQDLSWKSSGVGSNFVLIPNSSNVLIDGAFSYSSYAINLKQANKKDNNSKIDGFNFGINFKYFIGKNEVTYGFEAIGLTTNYTFFNELDRKIEQNENNTELAGFLKYKAIIGNLIFEPSFRGHYYASLGEFSPEPRLGMKLNVNDNFRLKLAAGLYSQNLIAAVSDRDVVNLFYGFLSAPENSPTSFKGEDITSKLQKARHIIAGFEANFSKNLKLNVEGYYFNFNQLTNINRNKLYDDNQDNEAIADVYKKDFIMEKGKSQGIDFLLKYEFKRLYIWVVYSLMKVTREDELINYSPVWDRRHNVNLVFSYNFGKKLDWEFNARWNYGSGFPFTQTQGFYENNNLTGNINSDYTTSNGTLGTTFGQLNQGRLPQYHRLDINLKKTLPVGDRSMFEFTAGVTNTYNRENIFYFNRVLFERINQLPILPSIGVNLKF